MGCPLVVALLYCLVLPALTAPSYLPCPVLPALTTPSYLPCPVLSCRH